MEHSICDIVYNDENCYVIICSNIYNAIQDIIIANESVPFTKNVCGHGHCTVYITKSYVYYDNIIVSLSDEHSSKIYSVSRYPSYLNEIIMSTVVYNEDSIIRQWIQFHQLLGVTRFIIYDNCNTLFSNSYENAIDKNKNNLLTILQTEIRNNIVLVIPWNYKSKFQQTQQNHSLYTFRKSKLIGFMDVDEYINLQKVNTIHEIYQHYSNTIGFTLANRDFHNSTNISEVNFDFLHVKNCDTIIHPFSRSKLFLRPIHMNIISVHTTTKDALPAIVPYEEAYFNHYVFLNKKNRGRTILPYQDNSILRIAHSLL